MIADTVVISRVYAGAEASATIEAYELYNATGETVVLTNWRVRDNFLTGTSRTLSGTMAPFSFALVSDNATINGVARDVTTTVVCGYSGNSAAVALHANTTATDTVDIVGWASAVTFEGQTNATTLDVNSALARLPAQNCAGGGMIDRDSNVADFIVQTSDPAPRNSASAAERLAFSCTAPASVALNNAFTLSCTNVVFGTVTTCTDYTGSSAWANISVPAGFTADVSQTGLFTDGAGATSITITAGSGSCTITVSDAYCTGTVVVNVISAAPVPNPAKRLTPAVGHDTNTPRPQFMWVHGDTGGVNAQVKFHLQLATDNGFSDIVYEETTSTANTSVVLASPIGTPADSTLYWRVRTSSSGDSFSDFPAGDSTVLVHLRAPNPPALALPADNAETEGLARFSWTFSDSDTPISTQDTFVIQFSKSSSFATTYTMDTQASSNAYYETTLPGGDTYFWRVRTGDLVGLGAYSESRAVGVDTVPGAFDHFTLSTTDPNLLVSSNTVRRGTAFNLRIRAFDAQSTLIDTFAGACTLAVTGGTISPSTFTFLSAWAGETTVSATISGAGAVGPDSITVSSGTKSNTVVVIPLADNRLVINEVLATDTGAPDRDEWIEIYNRSTGTVSTSGWSVHDFDASGQFVLEDLPAVSIPSGKFLVIHTSETQSANDVDFSDTDGAAHVFLYTSIKDRISTTDPFGLFAAASGSQDTSTLVSFVAWNSSVAEDDDMAVAAGLWENNTFVTVGAAPNGRSIYRGADGLDTNQSTADWGGRATGDAFTFTEGFSNDAYDSDLTGVSLILRTAGGGSDTSVIGESILITLTATGGGNASLVGVTNVYVNSEADSTNGGIVVTLRESAAGSRVYNQEIRSVLITDQPSLDGMRWIGVGPSDTITFNWVHGGAQAISSVLGPLDHFDVVAAPSTIVSGSSFDLTVTARTAAGIRKSDYTGVVNVAVALGSITPESFALTAADAGETTFSAVITGGVGTETITATAATEGDTGRTTVTIQALPSIKINELLANPENIDWDGDGTVVDGTGGDDWIELYNDTSAATSLEGMMLTRDGANTYTIPAGETILGYGYKVYFADSLGFALTNGGATIQFHGTNGVALDTVTYPAQTTQKDYSYGRTTDGAGTFTNFSETPVYFSLSASTGSVGDGESFTINCTGLYPTRLGETTLTATTGAYNETVVFSVSSGSVAPAASGVFSAGLRSDSMSISGTCGSIIITATVAGSRVSPGYANASSASGTTTIFVGSINQDSSRVNGGIALADGFDTSLIQVFVYGCTGAPVTGATVTLSSSKGAADTITPSSQVTNNSGVVSFSIVSRDTALSTITATVGGTPLTKTGTVSWIGTGDTGNSTGFATVDTVLAIAGATAGYNALFPVWRSDGKAVAYIAKTASYDSWAVYASFDDGAHGDGASEDGNFVTLRVTGGNHEIFHLSRPAWCDVLSANGSRDTGGAGDGVQDIVFGAWNRMTSAEMGGVINNTQSSELFAVRSDGSDSTKTLPNTVHLTPRTADWVAHWFSPATFPGTDKILVTLSGNIWWFNGRDSPIVPVGPIIRGNLMTPTRFILEAVPYDADNVAVAAFYTGGANAWKKSDLLLARNFSTYQNTVNAYKQVNSDTYRMLSGRSESYAAWNLSWDMAGSVLAWAEDRSGNFNWTTVLTNAVQADDPFASTDFDVRAARILSDGSNPSGTLKLYASSSDLDEFAASFSPSGDARILSVRQSSDNENISLRVATIDGATEVDAGGGILYENGLVTAVIDENDVLSGSIALRIAQPAAAPSNPTSESIALTGTTRDLFPAGITFADSIQIRLYYDAADLAAAGITNGSADEYRLKAYFYHAPTSTWRDYGGIVDPTDANGALGSITFLTNHFSRYAIGVRTDLTAYAILRSRAPRVVLEGETIPVEYDLLTLSGDTFPGADSLTVTNFGSLNLAAGSGSESMAFASSGLVRIRPTHGGITGGIDLVVLPHPRDDPSLPFFLVAGDVPYPLRAMTSETALAAIAYLPGATDSSLVRLDASALSGAAGDSALAPTLLRPPVYWWSNLAVGISAGETALLVLDAPGETDPDRLRAEVRVHLRPGAAATVSRRSGGRTLAEAALPAAAADTALFVRVYEDSAAQAGAILLAAARGIQIDPASVFSFEAQGPSGDTVTSFSSTVRLGIAAPAVGNPRQYALYTLGANGWEKIGGTYDDSSGLIVADVSHFSVWALGLAPNNSVHDAVVFPNPWRIDGVGTGTAGLSPGDARYGIKIDRLPGSPVRVRIFTLAGQLVLEGSIDPATGAGDRANGHLRRYDPGGGPVAGTISWDLRNQHGREVASGVYLILLEGAGGTASRKVAVIR